MLIGKVGRKATGYAVEFAQRIKTRRTNGIFKKSAKSSSITDTFVKEAENAIPEDLQIILDKINIHCPEKREFFTELYKTGKSKFNYIINHENFGTHMPYFNDKEFLRAIKQIDEKELQKTFDEITELYEKLPKVGYDIDKSGNIMYKMQKPYGTNLAQLTILKVNNKEAYNYILNHPDKDLVSGLLGVLESRINGQAIETLTVPQIRQITGEGIVCNLTRNNNELIMKGSGAFGNYVESSDELVRNAEKSGILSEYLSHFKVSEQFTAFRGEKDTGMFATIVLDKKLAQKTKWLVTKNMFKAKKIPVNDYTGEYETFFAKKQNLFSYITGKEQLTLADAMQVAKYGDESYRKQIIELIKNSQLKDTRFKSLTFDRGMAEGWMPSCNAKNTTILQDMTITEGLQGKYSHVNNRQAEFVLNNNEKTITFQDVVYNPERDIFEVKSTVS